MPGERSFAYQLGFALAGAAGAKRATRKTGILLQLDIFVISMTARRIEEEQTKRVARPAIVTEIALETRLFDARLFVNGSDGVGGVVGDLAEALMVSFLPATDRLEPATWRRRPHPWEAGGEAGGPVAGGPAVKTRRSCPRRWAPSARRCASSSADEALKSLRPLQSFGSRLR